MTLFALFFIFRHYPLFFQKNENNAINTSKFTIFTSFNGTNIRDLITRQTFVVITCFWRDMGYVAFTRFCRESGFVANTRFFGCLVQTFTQTLRILLRYCADICPKNWPLGPQSYTCPFLLLREVPMHIVSIFAIKFCTQQFVLL